MLAQYSGDANYAANTGSYTQVVNQGGTSTSLASVSGASVLGEPVAFIAFVSAVVPAAGTPTGNVTFKEGATVLASNVTLSGGQASFSTTSLSVGSHTITAVYSGDANFLTSNSSRTDVVNQAATTIVVSSPGSPVFGQRVVFTATVVARAPSTGIPTGTADFKEGATDLTPGGVTLVDGSATFTTSSLSVGQHTITVSYGGSASFLSSSGSDAAAPLVVSKASSRTLLTASSHPAVFGQTVTFSAAVSALFPGKGTPTGAVIFTDGTTTIASISLNGGRATFTTASLSRGGHTISANYGGDGNFLPSVYPNAGLNVLQDSTTTTVTPSANPVVLGQTLTLTATVKANAPGSGTPTGTVVFKDITTVLGTGTLNGSGQATFSTSGLAVGTHAITASYGGDTNFTSDVSPIIAQVVKSPSANAVTSVLPVNGNVSTHGEERWPTGSDQRLESAERRPVLHHGWRGSMLFLITEIPAAPRCAERCSRPGAGNDCCAGPGPFLRSLQICSDLSGWGYRRRANRRRRAEECNVRAMGPAHGLSAVAASCKFRETHELGDRVQICTRPTGE